MHIGCNNNNNVSKEHKESIESSSAYIYFELKIPYSTKISTYCYFLIQVLLGIIKILVLQMKQALHRADSYTYSKHSKSNNTMSMLGLFLAILLTTSYVTLEVCLFQVDFL